VILKEVLNAVPAGHREKLWREFFLDPSQWWDHRPEKVAEHQSCYSSHVNGAKALEGVNIPVSLLVDTLPFSELVRNSFRVLCNGGIVVEG